MTWTVVAVHNRYREPGGEDEVFRAETRLLREAGHEVVEYTEDNRNVDERRAVALATKAVWNHDVYRKIAHLVRTVRPDVVHVHNTLPRISPAVFHAATAAGAATVHTVHNYRLLCTNGLLYRAQHVCEECVGKRLQWPAVVHRCYRGSRAASAVVAAVTASHRGLGTWRRHVDLFVAPTRFCREKLVTGGVAADRIVVKPHFVAPDPGAGEGGTYGLFVGRLAEEKGVTTLLEALPACRAPGEMVVAGDGPLAPRVEEAVAQRPALTWCGRQPLAEVYALMRKALFVVVPSGFYETFGRVVAEAFACGTPVITARDGAAAELVEAGVTGLHFTREDSRDLARQLDWAWTHRDEMDRMRPRARREFESKYSAERNREMLLAAYERAASVRRGR